MFFSLFAKACHEKRATFYGCFDQRGRLSRPQRRHTNEGRFGATKGVSDRIEIDLILLTEAKKNIEELEIDGLISIGGDGSLAIAHQLFEEGEPVIAVPKTIDNDLSSTPFSFGFDSAIQCASAAGRTR